MSLDEEPKAFKPILALWSLGGIIGVPTLFLVIGFLVVRGHTSIFRVPSSLLQTSSQQMVFYGGQWALMTLSSMLHWVVLAPALLALLLISWRSAKTRSVPKTDDARKNAAILFGLILLFGLFVSGAGNLLSYTSDALNTPAEVAGSVAPRAQANLKLLLETPERDGSRDTIYRLFSLVGFVAAFAIPWLLKARGAGSGPARLAVQAAQLIAVVLASTMLLLWPVCFGRLQLSYDRPQVTLHRKSEGTTMDLSGIVLNPQNDRWTIVSCSAASCRYSSMDMKDLVDCQIGRRTSVFEYAASGKSQ